MATTLLIGVLCVTTIEPIANSPVTIDSEAFGMPRGSLILEARRLPPPARPNRAIAIWMIDPSRHPRDDPDAPYTCPEESRGSYYAGPTRASLIDLEAKRIINTVVVEDPHFPGKDTFDVPYRIHAGGHYLVEKATGEEEGVPTLLDFYDTNGDGKKFEFALYDAVFCMGLETALFGYDDRRDRLVQYSVQLSITGGDGKSSRTQLWTDYLFSKKPIRPSHWKYQIDYRGRGGCLDSYDIAYRPDSGDFSGTLSRTDCSD